MTAFAGLHGDWRRMLFEHHAVILEDLHDRVLRAVQLSYLSQF
jgi:hypothetical protein